VSGFSRTGLTMLHDLRFAVRMLLRERWFTLVAILSLAVGIGANTAIFSLIDSLMLRPLPVREPGQLVQFLSAYPGDPRFNAFQWVFYERVRDEARSFSDLLAFSPARITVRREGGADTLNAYGEYVSGNFFQSLGVDPALGRLISPNDVRGASAVAVLSWSFWESRFNRDPSIQGRTILVNDVPATVIGVAARGFTGLESSLRSEVWLPVTMERLIQRPSQFDSGQLTVAVLGRLKTSVSLEQAQAEMHVLNRSRVEALVSLTKNAQWRQARLDVESAAAGTSILRERLGRPLLALMGMVSVLLFLACVNLASLLLARGATRDREMAVRLAIGASRVRLWRQVLIESLLLSGAGGLLGIAVAYFGATALVRIMTSGRPMIGVLGQLQVDVQPDLRVLIFTAVVAVLTGVLFGLAPAWSASAQAPTLRDAAIVGERRSRRLLSRTLVVAQVALSLVLLSAAVLLTKHLSNLRNVNLGLERSSVLLVTMDPSRSGYERLQLSSLYRDLLARIERIPGVRAATLSGASPLSGAGASRFVNVAGVSERPEDRRYVSLNWIAPDYFETFGTTFAAGRDFSFGDEGRPPVAIVNQAMARHYFGTASPLGRRFTFDDQTRVYEIVGVVGDAKYLNLYETPPRMIYLNAFQEGRGTASELAVRTDGVAPTAIVNDVRRAVNDVAADLRIAGVRTLDEQIDASIVTERLVTTLSSVFGGIAALLAAVGLYGLLAYTVSRRTSEIGLRMALGAAPGQVRVMILRGAFGLVVAGLLIGAPFALLSPRFLGSLVERFTVEAPIPLLVASLAMIGVALLAAHIPARRAARIQPVEALRQA
jgi:predicted permease